MYKRLQSGSTYMVTYDYFAPNRQAPSLRAKLSYLHTLNHRCVTTILLHSPGGSAGIKFAISLLSIYLISSYFAHHNKEYRKI